VTAVLNVLWHGLRDAFLMAWEVWWALVLGFAISAIVQAWVPRHVLSFVCSVGNVRSPRCSGRVASRSAGFSHSCSPT
jgi:uncharacterized membrane protein YraQ (UPF0718 family)